MLPYLWFLSWIPVLSKWTVWKKNTQSYPSDKDTTPRNLCLASGMLSAGDDKLMRREEMYRENFRMVGRSDIPAILLGSYFEWLSNKGWWRTRQECPMILGMFANTSFAGIRLPESLTLIKWLDGVPMDRAQPQFFVYFTNFACNFIFYNNKIYN